MIFEKNNLKAIADLGINFEIKKLCLELISILKICEFFEETNQISLRHRKAWLGESSEAQFKDGIGSLYDREKNIWLGNEEDFIYNHPAIKNSYLEKIIHQVESDLRVQIGRYRIMRLRPKTCYSWHKDPTPYRLHIPILTNSACFYLTESGGLERMPTLGQLYKVETSNHHTAVNGSETDRLHLVLSVI